jgi:hypothetical protein
VIILYGFRDRDLLVKSGSFECPNCRMQRFCKYRKIESWLTVFFLPFFSWELQAEYCQCDDRRRSFEESTLLPFFPGGRPSS